MSEKSRFLNSLLITIAFLMICWMLWLPEEFFDWEIKKWGMRPRELKGLIGIGSMHFLHGSFEHIGNNTLSFGVLNTLLFFFYPGLAWKVFWRIMLIGGALLWFWGRESNHIGASLLIYGIAAFVFISGLIRRDEKMLRVSLFTAFVYGSIVWWVLPIDPSISWEGHASGALVGVSLAWIYRQRGPQRKKYQWEIDEELEKERLEALGELPTDITTGVDFIYDFTRSNPDDSQEDDSEKS